MRKKIEDAAGLEKDLYSRGVVSTDRNALNAYKIQRQKMMKASVIESEVSRLKDDVNEIKQMLSTILSKINN